MTQRRGVLVAALLAVKELPEALVLGQGPQGHLPGAAAHVDDAAEALRADVEGQPAIDLGGVVGAGHKVEEEALGDAVLL